jgi:hypothetical protein
MSTRLTPLAAQRPHLLGTVGEGKPMVMGKSFRLSRQTGGLFLSDRELLKTKAKLTRRSGKPTYGPPGTPQN